MKFKIDQLAFSLPRGFALKSKTLAFLEDCGIANWTEDIVQAAGDVHGEPGANTAHLRFNYEAFAGKELELLEYTDGYNWLEREHKLADGKAIASHIGMHCSEDDLIGWHALMEKHGCGIVQEVWTNSHTNPRIQGCRRYHYVIFGTRHMIGVDMKFIVRCIIDEAEELHQQALDRVVAQLA